MKGEMVNMQSLRMASDEVRTVCCSLMFLRLDRYELYLYFR